VIETKIEGDPEAVSAAATWLRETLKTAVSAAADLHAAARTSAHSSWEGEAADAYRGFTKTVVSVTDEHEPRVGRAATALEDYATHLTKVQGTMTGLRTQALAGGLSVSGTQIQEPPSVAPSVVVPGSPEEQARTVAIANIELYNALFDDAVTTFSTHTDWIAAHLPADVEDAEEKDALQGLWDAVSSQLPNFAAGASAGLATLALATKAGALKDQATEFRRRSRTSGDPRVRGSADTPSGRSTVEDLLNKSRGLSKLAKFLGPAGVVIDVGFGIKEGLETGDWTRPALTTAASIATGVAVVGAIALAPITVPAAGVVLLAGGAAALASWGVGEIYDNWDDISEWGGDRVDGVKDFAGDVGDAVGGAWDSVTPW